MNPSAAAPLETYDARPGTMRAAQHDVAVRPVEARRPSELARLCFECPNEIKLITVRQVDWAHVDACGPRFWLALEVHGVGPDEERCVAPHRAARVAQRHLGVQLAEHRQVDAEDFGEGGKAG